MFKDGLKKHLVKAGWYGGKYDDLPDTPENQKKKESYLNWRLGVIFRTNLSTAYAAGKYRQMSRITDMRPIWVYSALLDKRTRDAHRALHNKAFRHDDPFWSSYYPPNGWNCRCMVYSLTESDAKARGFNILSSDKNGNPPNIAYTTEQGNAVQIIWGNFCPKEWKYNPGEHKWKPDWGKYTNLADIGIGKTTALDIIKKNHRIEELNIERFGNDDFNKVGTIMDEIRGLQEALFDDAYKYNGNGQDVFDYGRTLKSNEKNSNYQKRIGKNYNWFAKYKYGGIITVRESLKPDGEPETYVDYYVGGRVKLRRFYGEDGKAVLDLDTHNHGNAKYHPYSFNGFHAHDEPIGKRYTGDISRAEYYFNKDIYNDQK